MSGETPDERLARYEAGASARPTIFPNGETRMDERELRLRCLELAANANPDGAVKLAADYLAFVVGEPGESERRAVDAATGMDDVS